VVPVAARSPRGLRFAGLESNPDSALATPPAAFDGAAPGMHAYASMLP
jgi:hypothetical protein